MGWKDTLQEHFPKALRVGAMASRLKLAMLEKGLDRDNVLFGNALCRDELNQSTIARFTEEWGESFCLGGLGGYPSAGKTGAGAYTAHLPDDGTLLILYGPHIGIASDGELGMVERPGQSEKSTSCGALMVLQGKLAEDGGYFPEEDLMDIEQVALESVLLDEFEENQDLTLLDAAYQAIHRAIEALFPLESHPKQIRIGGVLINTSIGSEDYFQLRSAKSFEGGAETTDLLPRLLDQAAPDEQVI